MFRRKQRSKSSHPLPFSDDEIRTKAYEIWQSRNETAGASEDDWTAAISALDREHSASKQGANGEFGQNRTLSLKVFSCMTYRIL